MRLSLLRFIFVLVFIYGSTIGLANAQGTDSVTNIQGTETKIEEESETYLSKLKGTETAIVNIFCNAHDDAYLEELQKLVEVLSFKGGVAQAKIINDNVKDIVNLSWVDWIEIAEENILSEEPFQGTLTQSTIEEKTTLQKEPLSIDDKFLVRDQDLLKLSSDKPLKLGIICDEPAKHKEELIKIGVKVTEVTEDWLIVNTTAGKLKEIASLEWVSLILPAE